MTKSEEKVLRNIVRRLKGEHAAEHVRAALTGPARIYLETWVIPALEHLLPEKRDVKLALDLTALPADRKKD
jgi:hypothetical protein